MSHFTVTVVTAGRPTQEELAAVLQPFHEFECTGVEDQYVVDVDMTEQALVDFTKATEVRLKAPDGTLHDRFDDSGNWKPEFSKASDFGRREEFIPPGYERVELPASEVTTAAKWISGYHGWPIAGQDPGEEFQYGRIELDADGNVSKCIDRTNPNKKWDWWQIGGRWKDTLLLSSGRRADQATIGEIDIARMRAERATEFGQRWDDVRAAAGHLPSPTSWADVRERVGNIDAARTEYWEQPAIKAIKAAFPKQWDIDEELEALRLERDTYCKRGADGALSTFAILKDGEWHERGQMGWFGCVSNEMDDDDWDARFSALIADLPPEACLTVVDCHI